MIGFNKPYFTGKEVQYIQEAVRLEKLSGNGYFTKKCHDFFLKRYGFEKTLLTHSCTAALEMSAILIDIQPGDEVILPSFTFVSTANAFILRGAKLVFADSSSANPNMDADALARLITPKTKAIVVVHYAGMACEMDTIMKLAAQHDLFVIEDAAQGLDAYYKDKPLGSFGNLACFSFHETKNIISGEGGMLVVNDKRFADRSEIIWEKGTNRSAFFRGEVDKYNWIDVGSSFLPSEITAAFLWAQIEEIDFIQEKRQAIWQLYYEKLKPLQEAGLLQLPQVPKHCKHNAHLFYILTKTADDRGELINHLKANNIQAVFHYLSLHQSPYFVNQYAGDPLTHTNCYSDRLIRLPMYVELSASEVQKVTDAIYQYFHA